jgi:hypothetical protein
MMQARNQYRRWLGVVIAVVLISVTGCQSLGGSTDCNENPAFAWRAKFPPSAANIEERCAMNIVNPSYTATFTMSPTDLVTFQQSTPITAWETQPAEAITFKSEAERLDSLLFGKFSNGAVSMEVLIDTSDPQLYKVNYDAAFVD